MKPLKFLSESLLLIDLDNNQVKSVTNIAASKYQKTKKVDSKVTLRDIQGIDKFAGTLKCMVILITTRYSFYYSSRYLFG